MKKLLSSLLAAILLLSPCVEAKMNFKKVANKTLDTSVLIRLQIREKNLAGREVVHLYGCSGTYVSEDTILTAAHCVSPILPTHIWIRGIDGHSYPAEVIKVSAPHDLSLLYVHGVSHHKYSKIGHAPEVGDEILNVGSPQGFEFLVSQGIVSAVNVLFPEFASHYTITTAMINHGSSGGGMFNSKGNIVGVNCMSVGMFGWTGISIAVSTQDIVNFLK